MRRGRVAPRWVWIVWSSLMAAWLLGLGLWIVHGVVRGVPGPVVGGVYVTGPVDVVVVVAFVVAGAALATVAAIMVARIPSNPIGSILGAIAIWMATTFLIIMALYYLHSPGDAQTDLANWLGNWTFVIAVPTSLVLMIFPTGALPSPRWRVLPWLALLGTASWAIREASSEFLGADESLPNPYANPGLQRLAEMISIVLLPVLIGTIATLFVRYQRSTPDVRLQIKWVALGGAFQVVVWLLVWGWELFLPADFGAEAVAVGTLSLLIVPIALGAAILRYRLYDIDHLVSRTVSYAVLIALLAGAYFGVVIGIQALFPSSEDLAVAGITLAAAAAFNPLRLRIQDLVDRRFNRRRYDAERVIEAFTARISTVTHAETLSSDLTETLEHTMAPASIGIWIRH
jgi:hypothetical protein